MKRIFFTLLVLLCFVTKSPAPSFSGGVSGGSDGVTTNSISNVPKSVIKGWWMADSFIGQGQTSITNWPDITGNGWNLYCYQSNFVNAAKYDSIGFGGHPSVLLNSSMLCVSNILTTNFNTGYTIFFAYQTYDTASSGTLFSLNEWGVNGTAYFHPWYFNTPAAYDAQVYYGVSALQTSGNGFNQGFVYGGYAPIQFPTVGAIRWDGTNLTYWLNGCLSYASPSAGSTPSWPGYTNGTLYVGNISIAVWPCNDKLSELILCSTNLTDDQVRSANVYLNNKYGTWPDIIDVGDSLIVANAGLGGSGPAQLMNEFPGLKVQTVAVFGRTSAQQLLDEAVSAGGWVSGIKGANKRITVLDSIGINDAAGYASTNFVPSLMANITNFFFTLSTNGLSGVFQTLISGYPETNGIGAGANQSSGSWRTNVNQWARNNWTNWAGCVALSDAGGDANIGTMGAFSNLTYWPTAGNGLHPTNAGIYIREHSYNAPTIRSVIGGGNSSANTYLGTFIGNGGGLTNLNLGTLSGTTPALISSFSNSLWFTNNSRVYRVPVF